MTLKWECLSPVIFHRLCCEFGTGPLASEPHRSPGQCFHPCGTLQSAAALTIHCACVSVRKLCPQLSRIIAPCGAGHPSSPCPFTSSSFSPFLFLSFFHWLYPFSSFVHPFPFYQNSPTPFPGRRS